MQYLLTQLPNQFEKYSEGIPKRIVWFVNIYMTHKDRLNPKKQSKNTFDFEQYCLAKSLHFKNLKLLYLHKKKLLQKFNAIFVLALFKKYFEIA